MEENQNVDYSASNITVLEGLEAVRVRPVLPFATATDTEVLTKGSRAYITILYEPHLLALS